MLERWDEFVGAGIFYAANELEARFCADGPVTVVGGGNGAGQAALFLASCGCDVTVAIRRPEVESGMSRYLVDRLFANPKISVPGGTEVTHLDGSTGSGRRSSADQVSPSSPLVRSTSVRTKPCSSRGLRRRRRTPRLNEARGCGGRRARKRGSFGAHRDRRAGLTR